MSKLWGSLQEPSLCPVNNPVNYYDAQGTNPIAILGTIAECLPYVVGAVIVYIILTYPPVQQFISTTADAIAVGISTTYSNISSMFDTKTDSKAEEKEKDVTVSPDTPEQYNYWTAEIVNNNVTPMTPLTYSDARKWVDSGGNLLCINHSAAIAIVKFYPTAIWDPAHGSTDAGYLNHYHLSSAHANHIWYYGE